MPARTLTITTPLGDDQLLLRRMAGQEELGRLFRFDLDLISEKGGVAAEDLLGQGCTVHFEPEGGPVRHFHGIVSSFSHVGFVGRNHAYTATLRPWFWFLTRTTDCRIFQEMTVPDIIKQVFRDAGFTDFEESLSESYRTWEYCVCYRESLFNFVSRLMEQEGIYYYFRHEDGQHKLVLSDSYSSHEPIPEGAVPFFPPAEAPEERDHIFEWKSSTEVQPGKYAHDDFDFKKPKADLAGSSANPREHDLADGEIFDHPGEYVESSEGADYAKRRIEELHVGYRQFSATGNARGLAAGGLFNLEGHPLEDQNVEYLIISATFELHAEEFETATRSRSSAPKYTCSFRAIESQQPFRSARTTPKPMVQGPQTAVVVGKSGEEIWTDEHGRIKVQFHWDRYGASDQNSSCWVRVAQLWAGKGWGGQFIPRMGHEVIVEFLEGDPDRPIVTGSVYNGDNPPPYEVPANKTQSGVKSRSSKGGSGDNFNEIRMEDKKGEEELYFHAEKNQSIVVENNRNETVGHDRSLTVGNDKSETVGNNKSIQVAVDHQERIDGSMNVMVANNLTETVGINYSETVGGAMEATVGGAMAITVGAGMSETVGAGRAEVVGAASSETVGASKSLTVGGSLDEEVGAGRSVEIGKDLKENVGGKHSETVAKEYVLQAKKIQLVAKDEISIKAGKAEIVMKKNGDITIKGKKINVKGSGDVVIKGSKIKEN